MYCSKCGKQINQNANFCPHCGNKIKQTTEIEYGNKKKNRKIYITLFLLLILPAIISKIFFYAGYPLISENTANILSIVTTIGIIILTIWYSLAINIKIWQAILLGAVTLLPIMPWAVFILLLNKQKKSETKKFFYLPESYDKQGVIVFFLIMLFLVFMYIYLSKI